MELIPLSTLKKCFAYLRKKKRTKESKKCLLPSRSPSMTAGLSVPAASVSSNALLLLPTWRLLVVTFSAGWDDDVTPPCELGDAASTFEVCALVGWACFLDRLLCDLLCNDPLECAPWSSSCCVLSALARVIILERTCCIKIKQNKTTMQPGVLHNLPKFDATNSIQTPPCLWPIRRWHESSSSKMPWNYDQIIELKLF